jgi:hypothetical protein
MHCMTMHNVDREKINKRGHTPKIQARRSEIAEEQTQQVEPTKKITRNRNEQHHVVI